MTARLMRALQRGGITSQTTRDVWSVWRQPDRRGRIIGTLPGGIVETLRFKGQLAPLGDLDPVILVWSGELEHVERDRCDLPACISGATYTCRSLIELMIQSATPQVRAEVAQAAALFRDDVQLASGAGHVATMNWTGLAESRLSEPSNWRVDAPERGRTAIRAEHQLNQITKSLGGADARFLYALVVAEKSRAQIARDFQLRPAAAETKAKGILRYLMRFYGISDYSD